MRVKRDIHLRNLRNLRDEILDSIALQKCCKIFNAKATKECAKFAKLFFEALCFYEDAEISDPVLRGFTSAI